MARADAIGLFWEDVEKVKILKEVIKRTPPERTWERPDYLPGLEEAQRFDVPLFTDKELIAAQQAGERMVFDIECYPNYFLIAFRSIASGKVCYFERTPEQHEFDAPKLDWVLQSFTQISFNGIKYDATLAALALAGKTNTQLKEASNRLIGDKKAGIEGERPAAVLKTYKVKKLKFDHIDLIEVAPLFASLKIYAGCLHAQKMQDLPFYHLTVLSPEQIAIVRFYCVNDLVNTELLYQHLFKEIQLRESMSKEYSVDLRSKSDAQIAEAVIVHEITKMTGRRPQVPEMKPGEVHRYKVPPFANFQTPNLQWVLETVRNTNFIVSFAGNIEKPPQLDGLTIPIGAGLYRMGIGGLHSSEKKAARVSNEEFEYVDIDVSSNYPIIILNLGLFPPQMGAPFLTVYRSIVDRRLAAKARKDKLVADMLKIVVNGSFGKFGSPYSTLYAPSLLIQTTITGQLALLMLIERLELVGVHVMSANTDGILVQVPRARRTEVDLIFKQWRKDTQFETEEVSYSAVYSRDVNNYIAVKYNGENPKGKYLDERLGCKAKGAFCERGSSGNSVLSKNPTNLICTDAVLSLLAKGEAIEDTIRSSKDIRRFVSVRTVNNGGAVKDGIHLGKAIRWYYANDVEGEIVYADSGNKVPRSDGAKHLMELPAEFPSDINYDWYIKEANSILTKIGYA